MFLLLRHPKIACRSCQLCREFVYDEKTGEQSTYHGQPIKRSKRTGPPCTLGSDKCPKGHWSNPASLSPWNQRAYFHYLTCKAVCSFPDDETVRRNAGLIRSVEDVVSNGQLRDFYNAALMIGNRNV